jgi:DNA-directed RNA polymerase specialized sigma24 family protein
MAEPYRDIRNKHFSAYALWTPETDVALLDAYSRGYGIDALAKILQRSPGAVRSRLRKLLPVTGNEDTEWEHS